ncbi:hypothetical protein Cme02nite_50050 [Catellatospora methionotrophica]|uniref:Major facilitator superfamily (MFS) profile domain-containing protein n=1 Tax=Catellatospora methionotrophica TaxID=121620 RepID=A0A8J3L956_9ACTN|nr:MFS transporter [Catellatospora methionotrophica]GIG16673.1 hypothetical protein Cme02nite_50050 [Catellatospora methionotrophica]
MSKLTGWRAFTALWGGQTVSMIGSGLFAFAVGVWVYQRTGSATMFSLILFFDMMPGILIAPYAGVVADRVNRRTLMLLANTGCAISSLLVAAIALADPSPSWLWLLYPALILGGVSASFHGAAYEASFALLVEERHLGRANGLMQFGYGVAEVAAPLAAGILLLYMDIWTLILFDVLTFVVANIALLLLAIPRPDPEDGQDEPTGRLREDLTYGLRFLRRRPGLLMLLGLFAMLNFLASLAVVAVTPLVLSFGDEAALGTVTALGGAGIIVGGLLMTAWGGTRRRIVGLLAATALAGVFLALYGVRPSVLLVAVGAFGFFFSLPIINASSGAIWQASVPPAVQGRVFAVRRILAQASGPIAFIVGGLAIDRWLSPLLAEPGGAADVLGPVFGTGTGRGIGLLFVAMGALMIVVAALGAASPALRGVEHTPAEPAADGPAPVEPLPPTGPTILPESARTHPADAAPHA